MYNSLHMQQLHCFLPRSTSADGEYYLLHAAVNSMHEFDFALKIDMYITCNNSRTLHTDMLLS